MYPPCVKLSVAILSLCIAATACGSSTNARSDGSSGGNGGSNGVGGGAGNDGHFSFFVTSVGAMKRLSGNALGFGGDLRYGETGDGAGLRGADKICATIAETSRHCPEPAKRRGAPS